MARLLIGAVFGVVVGTTLGAALGIHAQDPDAASNQQLLKAAELAGVDPVDLAGAVNSTGLPPMVYLRGVGELDNPPPTLLIREADRVPLIREADRVPPSSRLAECIIQAESRGNPRAVNARSGASGLGQFLASTWRTTPQGKAGLSVFDPVANRAAVNYMISAGRAREFSTLGLCK